ncbi:MAG: hypothetical protein CSB47_01770 [Proteobacteria bacterium]|nr:MAG: hypothetical protein CSB47_01770 [Pseudomonadota bacterium]
MTTTQSAPVTWSAYKAAHPKTRIRNAAEELGISELELLSTEIGHTCIRLSPNFAGILDELPSLGPVMALTRNDAVVHETTFPFGEIHWQERTALYLQPGQCTRYFTTHWAHAIAVEEDDRKSLQFFDHYGEAVHKIYLTQNSKLDAYQRIVEAFRSDDQTNRTAVEQVAQEVPATIQIDKGELRGRWSTIENAHQSDDLIEDFGGNRSTIYAALGEEYATRLDCGDAEVLLTLLSEHALSTNISVQNHAAVQSYCGSVKRLLRTGPWFNVLDPTFNLHLNTEQIAQVWVIKKPSDNGLLHSIDVLDNAGQSIVTIADDRLRNQPESAEWQEIVSKLRS